MELREEMISFVYNKRKEIPIFDQKRGYVT